MEIQSMDVEQVPLADNPYEERIGQGGGVGIFEGMQHRAFEEGCKAQRILDADISHTE